MALTREFSLKIYNSIPFCIVLLEFLFDNMKKDTSHYNYMSLLLFKNYHNEENTKRDNPHTTIIVIVFAQCNILLNTKFMKLNNEMQDYGANWPEVVFSFFWFCAMIYVIFVVLFCFVLFCCE